MVNRWNSNLAKNSRGDTIVEVLIAIAILGVVLGSAYVATRNNTQINRSSQERLQAVKIAESQLEQLKALANSSTTSSQIFNPSTSFCIGSALAVQTGAGCAISPVVGSPLVYTVSILPTGNIGVSPDFTGKRFKIEVTWSRIGSGGQERVAYEYGVYRP